MADESSKSAQNHSALNHDASSGGGSAPVPSPRVLKKSYQEILEQEIEQGEHELKRPARGLLLSGLAAGMDVGFSVLVLAILDTLSSENTPLQALLRASAYSAGFILVIFGRSELFTEHTTLAVLPVLARRGSLRQLLRLWGLVLLSNLCGATLFSFTLVWLGPALGVIDPAALGALGVELTRHGSGVIFGSAVMAGWMMGLVSWLVTAGRDTVGQIVFVWFITGIIGLATLHHSIVGSIEVLSSLLLGTVSWQNVVRFLCWAVLGNVVGGTVFVAVLRYGHARAAAPGTD